MVSMFRESAGNLRQPRALALSGMLLALEVVLALFSIPIGGTIRVSFGFLAIGLSGALLGPVPAMLQAVLADFLGMVVNPMGAYFPGYTLTALLVGLVYGLLLYRRTPSWKWVLAAQLIVNIALHILLNTLWTSMTVGKAFWVLLPGRILKNVAATPLETLLLWGLWMLADRLTRSRGALRR